MTARITLALLAIIPAAMAYPWHTTAHKWVLGVAVAVVLIVFAWWRGLFLTTMVRRRFAVLRRNRSGAAPAAPPDRVTAVLQVEDGLDPDTLPLVAGYVDRYGIRCESVRVTERQLDGKRSAWVSVTVGAKANLSALQARSSDIPLADTAEKVARRLADQLRETGLQVSAVDSAPAPLRKGAREQWRAVCDDDGYLTAYGLKAGTLPESLAALKSDAELWTVLEFTSGTTVSAACAVRTVKAPATAAVSGLVRQPGRQGPLLAAMAPASTGDLGVAAAPLTTELLAALAVSETAEPVAVS